MSVFTEISTDDVYIQGKVNEVDVDWPNIAYKSDLGGVSNVVTALTLGDESSGVVIKAPGGSSNYELTFPEEQGPAGSVLKNDGSGNLTWSDEAKNDGTLLQLTDDMTLTPSNRNIIVDASVKSITITLPEVEHYDEYFIIVGNISDNTVTIQAQPGYTFDGDTKTFFILTRQHQKIQLKCVGTPIWYST